MDTETCACVLNMKLKPSDAFWHLMKLGFLQPPKFSFYDASKPTFTSPRYLPPTKIERCRVSSYSTQPFFSWLLYKFWSLSHTCHELQPSSVRKTTFSSSGWTTGSSYVLKSCTHLMMISHRMQVKDSIISHGCFLQECSVEHSVVGVRSRLESGVQLKVWSQKWKYQKLLESINLTHKTSTTCAVLFFLIFMQNRKIWEGTNLSKFFVFFWSSVWGGKFFCRTQWWWGQIHMRRRWRCPPCWLRARFLWVLEKIQG